MPRNIPANVQNLLDNKLAIEAINVVEVRWVNGGKLFYYSDRKYEQTEGKLISLSNIDSVINVSEGSSSTSLSIQIDDSDGTIKNIFNNNDIHGRNVKIYQWFVNIPFNEKFLIFEGQVASPLIWDEGGRILNFDVLTKLQDVEVGFSVEEGDFINVPEEIIGKAWPLIFGTCQHVPTVQLDPIPSGTTKVPLSIPDDGLRKYSLYVSLRANESLAKASCLSDRGASLRQLGIFYGNKQLFQQGQALERQAADLRFQAIQEYQGMFRERIQAIKAAQEEHDRSIFAVFNGNKFIQKTTIVVDINGAKYTGQFIGENFHVQSRMSPEDKLDREYGTERVLNREFIVNDYQEDWDRRYADMRFGNTANNGQLEAPPSIAELGAAACEPPYFYIIHTMDPNSAIFQKPKEGKQFFANAGSVVRIAGNYPIRYIITIVPGVEVLGLAAKRNVNGLKVLSIIPPEYYTISTMNFGPITATIATFRQPLSTIDQDSQSNVGWEDDVYATVRSSIGPNVVDIISWLITNHTSHNIDQQSFNYVRNKQINYPANFALLDRPNLLSLLKDIAYQSRCAIWFVNNRFYLAYLPEEGNIVTNVKEDDIASNSLKVLTTNTEDLVTKYVAEWKPHYALTEDYKLILRYNIPKYGVQQKNYKYFIYNNVQMVLKSATFWLIRESNIWKKVQFRAFINKIKLETMDTVQLNFDKNFVANVDVNGIVEKATYNAEDLIMDMIVWTPVRLGEMVPYLFAYPANISIQEIFPTLKDVQAGITGNFGADAEGDLGVKFNITTTKYNRGTAQSSPSDQADQAPPTITTANYMSSLRGEGAVPQPINDYRFDTIDPPPQNQPPPLELPSTTAFTGQLVSKIEGNLYNVDLYLGGLDNQEMVERIQARDPQLDPEAEFPLPVYVSVNRTTTYVNNQPEVSYTFRMPTWS